MNELRVLFTAAEDKGYLARLADADGSTLGVEVPFTPFLTEDDYENLRWYLEEYMDLPDGGAVVRAQRIEEDLERVGPHGCTTPCSRPPENRGSPEAAARRPGAARADHRHRPDPVLLRLPWELMADDAGSLAQRVSVRRQLEDAGERPRLAR